MKLPLLVLTGLVAVAVTACGGGTTEIYLGTLVEGATDKGGESQGYVIDVDEGVEHYIFLSGTDSNIAGIWSAAEEDYLIEISPAKTARTVVYAFPGSGIQELYVRSLDTTIAASFAFKIYVP